MHLHERGAFLDLLGSRKLLLLLRGQVLAVLEEHVAVALDLLCRLLVHHCQDLSPSLVNAVVERFYDMKPVDDDCGIREEVGCPRSVGTRHVHADGLYVLLERGDLPLEPLQSRRAFASGYVQHGFAVLVAHGRYEPAARPFVPEHMQLVDADVLDLAVVPPPVAFAQTVLDGVADGAPRYAVFLCQRLHRDVGRAFEQLLRKQSCDARVLVCCEGDALVRDGPAIATDYLSDRHYETDLAFPVRQPDERSVSVSVRTDVARSAFGAVCVRTP